MAQVWAVAADGGYMYSDELSDVLRMKLQPMVRFRQHCDAKDATDKGLNKGDKFYWDVYSDVAERGGDLDEQEEMPETKYQVSQASLTIGEQGNSVPFSGKLDNFSKHPVKEVINKVLKNDACKALDAKAWTQFDATVLTAAATATGAITVEEGGCTVTNNVALDKSHVKLIVDEMKERNIPMFDGQDYFAIAWPSTFRAFKNNLEALHIYVSEGYRKVMNGEIGRYEGTRFLEQTNIAKGGAVDSTTHTSQVKDAWNNAKSDWCFFFGEDTVAEAIVIPEELRGKIPTDYGRSKGIAWYSMIGYGIVHADATNARILKWESAA